MSTNAQDRDWDAEFAQIARHLEADTAFDDAPRPGAHRDLFDQTPMSDTPSLRHDVTPSRPRKNTTPDAPAPPQSLGASEDAQPTRTPSLDASSSNGPQDGAVPGFKPQWRIQDTQPAPSDDASSADDDTFVPPEPAPFETGDPASVIMLGCLVLGPLWLLYLALFDRDAATLWWIMAAGVLVGGFALAVARQPKSRDEDDDLDDGARV